MQLNPRFALAVLFGLFTGVAAAPAQSAPSAAPAGVSIPPPTVALPPGMTPLFDGKTLDGWVQLPADSWSAQDGTIVSRGVARGVIYTAKQYGNYRVIFDVRHISGKPDHQSCVLFFGATPIPGVKGRDALGAEQFILPNGSHWDYRKGHNGPSNEEFTSFPHPKFDGHLWSRVEILVNADKGTARMAVAQPVGSAAVEVVDFQVQAAGRVGPFALQMHNPGLFDEYANLAIEENPAVDDLITVKPQP
jgi:hypothetical protein